MRKWIHPKFKFSIDPQWPLKSNFINRLATRVTARMIFHALGESYQFGGYTGMLMEKYLSLIHIPSPRDRTRSRMPSSA